MHGSTSVYSTACSAVTNLEDSNLNCSLEYLILHLSILITVSSFSDKVTFYISAVLSALLQLF